MFRQDCSCPALLEDRSSSLPVRGYHPLWPAFPDGSGSEAPATGLVRFRSPLLAESRLMSFPPGTEMFQFSGFASCTYEFSAGSSLSKAGHVQSCLNMGGPPSKPKYSSATDSEQVP